MVYALLDGRIGNTLFQVAAAASLAHQNNTGFRIIPGTNYVPDSASLAQYLKKFEKNLLRKITIAGEMPVNTAVYKEKEFSYHPIPYSENIILDGFFQSEKYFMPEIVHDLFEIDPETRDYILSKYGHLLKDEITSIHVRRGDYLKSSDNYAICSRKYFRDAIRQIGKDKRFLITSDDIPWCKKTFRGNNFFFSEGETAVVDMYLQSMCTNNVISNSSFSWWGSYLNRNPGKTVIAPEPWFGPAYRSKSTRDLIPENWIRMKNRTPINNVIAGYLQWWKKRIRYFIKTKILK